MMKTFTLLAATAATAIGLLVAAPTAAASSVTCTGTLPDPVVTANVVVPAGGLCAFDGASVTGNVFIGPGAIADLAFVSIDGNVQSNGAAVFFLKGSVTGNVRVTGGATAAIFESFIGGNLVVSGITGFVNVNIFNEVGGNLAFNDNTAPDQTLVTNTVGGNLSCEGNDPFLQFTEIGGEPFGNTVGGHASGQCAVEQ